MITVKVDEHENPKSYRYFALLYNKNVIFVTIC